MATSEWEVGHGLTVSELAITVSCPRVGTVVCTLVGEVDLATESLLREQLQQAVMAGPRHLIVNLSDVSFLSVGGVGVLLETWRAQQDRCEMVLVGASHRVTLVLDVLEQGNLMPCLHGMTALFRQWRAVMGTWKNNGLRAAAAASAFYVARPRLPSR